MDTQILSVHDLEEAQWRDWGRSRQASGWDTEEAGFWQSVGPQYRPAMYRDQQSQQQVAWALMKRKIQLMVSYFATYFIQCRGSALCKTFYDDEHIIGCVYFPYRAPPLIWWDHFALDMKQKKQMSV
ncbi:hypothetical protein AK812_SmicGene34052 [Symbiodinium microadriaticum]|uniref:Uncharacterized protein n=1 Tax=Symbiodinium microadriaticum TaxID=2951 RepID=A0A1Q9CQ19_SYMMI|nr:hypothetical protein AK812_SmicGene34052 [Symbiodinium microadriaticum]